MPTYTSLTSYRQHVMSGRSSSQQAQILACLIEQEVPLSRRQIKVLTGLEINAVTGRVNTLLKSGLIQVAFEAEDPETERVVEYLEPVWPVPVQRKMRFG